MVPFSHAFFFFFSAGLVYGQVVVAVGGWMSGSYLNLPAGVEKGEKEEEGACGFDGLGFFGE